MEWIECDPLSSFNYSCCGNSMIKVTEYIGPHESIEFYWCSHCGSIYKEYQSEVFGSTMIMSPINTCDHKFNDHDEWMICRKCGYKKPEVMVETFKSEIIRKMGEAHDANERDGIHECQCGDCKCSDVDYSKAPLNDEVFNRQLRDLLRNV